MEFYIKHDNLDISQKYNNNIDLSSFLSLLSDYENELKTYVSEDDEEVDFNVASTLETNFKIKATFDVDVCTYCCIYLNEMPMNYFDYNYSLVKFDKVIKDIRRILLAIYHKDQAILEHENKVSSLMSDADWYEV